MRTDSNKKQNKNNKIPNVIKDFLRNSGDEVIDFLSFKDWISTKEHLKSDWVVIARSFKDKSTETDLFTFSVLAKMGAKGKNPEKILKTFDWDVRHTELGHPSFYTKGINKRVYFDPGEKKIVNGVEFRPIVFYRDFHGYVDSGFELSQNFIIFFNAFYLPGVQEYQRIDEDGNIYTVAKIIKKEDEEEILVDSYHLRDYLAVNKAFLVRYHDHRRKSKESIADFLGAEKFKELQYKNENCFYTLWLRMDIPWNDLISASRLLGKDVIKPFTKALDEHTKWADLDRKESYAEFIIGIDNSGKVVEATCNEERLSNYFSDRGTPHFLTPVYFDRKVLLKYYQEPKKFKVNNRYVGCLDLWGIPIDITDENLVQVWIGDLGRIPYKEQLHWKQYNVLPKGTITRHRWETDFMAEFAEPENDPVYYFLRSFDNLESVSKEKLNEPLFLSLTDQEKYLYETIRIPITNEWGEFDKIIMYLSKILQDSINTELLKKLTGLEIDGNKIKGPLDLLQSFLEKKTNAGGAKNLLDPLKRLQTLRSCSAAHRKGENFEKALKSFNYYGRSPQDIIKDILVSITKNLDKISHIVKS